MFAHRRGVPGRPDFHHVYASRRQVEMCGGGDVLEVTVRIAEEHEDAPYWGWLDTGKDVPVMIKPDYRQLCVCFQAESGMLERVRRGFGHPVRIAIQAAEPVPEPPGPKF